MTSLVQPRASGARAIVLVLLASIGAGAIFARGKVEPHEPIRFEPSVVYATLRLEGAVVRGAALDHLATRRRPLRTGDPLPVELTAYCLRGRTRRDHYVREGIVAADPRLFPLARYVEIYVGRSYFGRFLVDDTGGKIKGNRLDIWTPACADARQFGRRQGTAVLVPRPRGAKPDTLMTGRLGGARKDG